MVISDIFCGICTGGIICIGSTCTISRSVGFANCNSHKSCIGWICWTVLFVQHGSIDEVDCID